jgi:hypothetical protein
MNLPISNKEFDKILEVIKNKYPDLYSKLWCYKMNVLNGEKNNGFS